MAYLMKNLLITAGLAGMFACQQAQPKPQPRAGKHDADSGSSKKQPNCLKVTDGQATNDYAAVVMVYLNSSGAFCTGTFVSPTTLLTAKHCMENVTAPSQVAVASNGQLIPATNVIIDGGFTQAEMASSDIPLKDIAIVVFPPNTAPAVAKLASVRPAPGNQETIVGFGETVLNQSSSNLSAQKFVGRNVIQIVSKNVIAYTGTPGVYGVMDGVNAVSGHGDSGGPMFVDGGIVGICSAGNPIQNAADPILTVFQSDANAMAAISSKLATGMPLAADFYTNIFDPSISAVLRKAVTAGADIPGLSALEGGGTPAGTTAPGTGPAASNPAADPCK